MVDNRVRIHKFMAQQGFASRRKCEELINAGKVKVNGHTAVIGQKIDPVKDLVTVGKKKINFEKNKKFIYIMLNKPRGYITTVSDQYDRKTVMDLVSDVKERVYPVGRLDKDSEGLLLLTNDGSFSYSLSHPSHNFAKAYRVTVRPSVSDEAMHNLRNGIEIDGIKTAPAQVSVISEEENRTVLEFIIHEGRNRQIRKMCESQGLEVARLKRISMGSLKLGMLKVGKYRFLSEQEVKKLLRSAEKKSRT